MLNKIIFCVVFGALFLFDFACFVYGLQERNVLSLYVFISSPIWLGYITAKMHERLVG
jgi:hypothetical protein